MFWKFGGYGSVSPIDTILDRPDFTLEELLDESDLLGDIKALNSKLLDYLRQPDVISRLLDLVVAPKLEPVVAPEDEEASKDTTDAADKEDKTEDASSDAPNSRSGSGRVRLLALGRGRSRSSSSATDGDFEEEDEVEKKRNKYAYVACEVLACDNWTISDTLLDPANRGMLHKFWQFLKRPAPLDPLQAGYFTKVNESLFDKKVDEMVEFLKSADNAVQDMLRHVDSPMIMDLLLKIIILDRPEACQGIVEWLYTQDIIPTLLSFLSPENSWATQTSAGDFIKAIITVSANATQHEQTCIGPNELTRQLVSRPCIDELIGYMLKGGNALTVGVGIVIEVIRKNNSDYDPDVGTEANSQPSSRDPIYLGTLLRMFAQNVPNFMKLMSNAPAQKARLNSTFGERIEPLGFDRFKTCELMAELLHCSNMGLLNEAGAEELIEARDAERNRLRSEGKLTPNRGEEAPSSTDLMTMRLGHSSPADEGRRLEVTNSTAADEDGFEEVTHAAGLGEESSADQQLLPPAPVLPSNGPVSPSQPFMDKDEDDFVDEPLSSPRLKTHDDQADADNGLPFDDPDMLVAPLSPNKKRDPAAAAASIDTVEKKEAASTGAEATSKDGLGEGADDFVTEATEPALGEEAKRMVPDLERSDESDSSILFTPTISSLSESLDLQPPSQRATTPPPEASEAAGSTEKQSSIAEDEGEKPNETSEAAPHPVSTETEKTEAPAAEPAAAETTPAADHAATAQAENEDATSKAQPAVAEEKPLAEENVERNDADAEMEDGSIVIATRPSVADAANESFVTESRFSDPVVGDFLKMQFVDHRVIPNILSLFFSYPWNNFLHNVVYDVVQQVFNGPMDRGFNPDLAVSLFESADITNQIINGQLVSEQSQAATRMRMGYMGHLTLIAEEVVKFTERHPPELLSESVLEKVMSPDWIKYVEGPLAETRERDNAILGGVRPEVAMGNQAAAAGLAAVGLSGLGSSLGLSGSQGTSSALADAGLNGTLDLHDSDLPSGHEGSMNPFSISAGISSGFHSSSDEEDDDADDNDDEISNAFRAYTDPLNTSSSLLPPAIPPPPPPPPPPLNVPPSRARRQLAARLAMNKRNAEAEAAASAAGEQDDDAGAEEGRYNGSNDAEEAGDKTATDAASGDLSLRGGGSNNNNSSGGPVKTLAELLMQSSRDNGRIRNPFADDDDDDDDDDDERDERDEGDDEDDDEDNELYHANDEEDGGPGGSRRSGGSDVGRVGLGWNRGSWWRKMVQRDSKGKHDGNGRTAAEEGDIGGDDDGSSDEDVRTIGARSGQGTAKEGLNEANDGTTAGHANHADHDDKNEENDDEEFGDFAMPESVAGGSGGGGTTAAADSSSSSSGPATQPGTDNAADKGLIRPLALHPASLTKRNSDSSTGVHGGQGGDDGGGSNNPGSGLWSFERFGFLGGVNKDGTTASGEDDGLEVVAGTDGQQRAAQGTGAKQRAVLEDGDEDEVVV